MLDYVMRGGSHPNPRTEKIEKQIMEVALNRYLTTPHLHEKSLRWVYNITHFNSLYATRDPELVRYLMEVRPYPDWIEIETTTACNIHCKICENTYWKEKPCMMSYEQFLKIMEQFPNLKWIGMTGIGQSLLNPDYRKMIDWILDRDIYIEIFDNFYNLDKPTIKRWVKKKFSKIYCSLDAATHETYKELRVGSDWKKVIENLKYFDKCKKELNQHFPELFFHFIITKDNIHEVEKYVDFVHGLDIDVTMIQFSRMLHLFPEIEDQFVEIPDEFKMKVIEKGRNLGIAIGFNVNSTESQNRAYCESCTVWNQPFIFVTGDITPCCSLNEQNDRPWQVKNALGNLFKDDMRDIWYGQKYTDMIKGLQKNKFIPCCDRCVLFREGK